jgi:hypothetical protein
LIVFLWRRRHELHLREAAVEPRARHGSWLPIRRGAETRIKRVDLVCIRIIRPSLAIVAPRASPGYPGCSRLLLLLLLLPRR